MPYVSPNERERLNKEKAKAKQSEEEKYAYHPGSFSDVDEHARSVAQIPFYDWEGETAPVKKGFEYWTERERSEVPGNEYSLSFHEKYEVAHLLDIYPYDTDTAKLLDNIEEGIKYGALDENIVVTELRDLLKATQAGKKINSFASMINMPVMRGSWSLWVNYTQAVITFGNGLDLIGINLF